MKNTHIACRAEVLLTEKQGYYCLNCKRYVEAKEVRFTRSFPDCVTKVRYVGINSEEDARAILEMMKEEEVR